MKTMTKTALRIVLKSGEWVSSPFDQTTKNPALAATFSAQEQAKAEQVAKMTGGAVERFNYSVEL